MKNLYLVVFVALTFSTESFAYNETKVKALEMCSNAYTATEEETKSCIDKGLCDKKNGLKLLNALEKRKYYITEESLKEFRNPEAYKNYVIKNSNARRNFFEGWLSTSQEKKNELLKVCDSL